MLGFIFDLDGTLLNTLDDLANAANHVLLENGLPTHPVDAYRQMVGNGFKTLIERAVAPREFSGTELTGLVNSGKAWYEKHLLDNTIPYPGMTVALNMLRDAGAVLGVFTNKPHSSAVTLIKSCFPGLEFSFVIGARDGVPLKPDPAALLEEMSKLNLAREDTCYIGDSDVDMLTAKNAGLTSIGAAWGFRGKRELEGAGADIILEEPIQLLEIIPA